MYVLKIKRKSWWLHHKSLYLFIAALLLLGTISSEHPLLKAISFKAKGNPVLWFRLAG